MENTKIKWLKPLPIIGSIIAIISGGFGIWGYVRPDPEIPDLKGLWKISIKVTESRLENYINDEMQYRVMVLQEGTKLKGSGEQSLYNHKPAPSKFRVDPFTGEIDNDDVLITYLLHGNERQTDAMLKVKLDPDNDKRLLGTYHGNVADQSGTVEIIIE